MVKKEILKSEINSSKQNEKKEKTNKNSSKNIMIPFIIILGLIILFFSIKYLYHPVTNEESYVYNGFNFTKVSNLWLTEVQKNNTLFRITTRYRPMDVEDVLFEPEVSKKIINSNGIYLTVPPNLTSVAVLAMAEVGRIVGTRYNILNIPSEVALTEPNDNGAIVKTCEDAVNGVGVILFRRGNNTAVYSDKNCIIVQGEDDWEIVRAADRLTFALLGIMN